ncbi:MAG: hypothetical protein CW338_07765 [Clostridiales bacterium]|nr:hypothetical protein [Clostridiales bacterium]
MKKDILDLTIEKLDHRPSLLLHGCCAPCSSAVLERLSRYFDITLRYYNPNISPEAEYDKRVEEVKRLLREMPYESTIKLQVAEYDAAPFDELAKGLEDLPEGGARCMKCYEMRLRDAAEAAKAGGYEYFCTTLSISPYKNAEKLNEIGERLAAEYGLKYLTSDFKKQNGYLRSIQLSAQLRLYRQPYCGCEFSRQAWLRKEQEKKDREQQENNT